MEKQKSKSRKEELKVVVVNPLTEEKRQQIIKKIEGMVEIIDD